MKYLILLVMLGVTTLANADNVKRPDTYNYNRGLEEMSNGNQEEALDYFNKELGENPKNGYALSCVAMIRYTNEEYGKSLTAVDLALKNLPKKDAIMVAATHNLRADIYLALGDTVKALDDYASAIKVCPAEGQAYEKRAQIYYEQDKYDLADADYRQLIKLDQGGRGGYMGIGRNCCDQKRWDEAIEQFNIVIKMYSVDEVRNYCERYGQTVLKAPWSSSGRGVYWTDANFTQSVSGWIKRVIDKQGSIMAEKALKRRMDFAMEFRVVDQKTEFVGYSLFITEKSGMYRGNRLMSNEDILAELGKKVDVEEIDAAKKSLTRFIDGHIAHTYYGYIGVDMFIYEENGEMRLNPVVEINLRMTMGVVARILYDRYVAK